MPHSLVLLHIFMNYSTQMCAIIHVHVTDLPDESLRHHTTLEDIFCNQILDHSLNAQLHSSDYDDISVLEEFDSDKSVQK